MQPCFVDLVPLCDHDFACRQEGRSRRLACAVRRNYYDRIWKRDPPQGIVPPMDRSGRRQTPNLELLSFSNY
jgi:hypothetical protein